MEPISTAAAAVAGYLAKTFADQKSFKDFIADFSQATTTEIRPWFLKEDDALKTPVKLLQAEPSNNDYQQIIAEMLEMEVKNNPQAATRLNEMATTIQQKQSAATNIQINNNSGAKIGQQNINSTVNNSGANFNFD